MSLSAPDFPRLGRRGSDPEAAAFGVGAVAS
jgi:hypothetical protein